MALWGRSFVQSLSHDVRLAMRSLGRSPGFVVAAVLSLGLALGAGIAGFSVVEAVRFRALPFPEAGRLVLVSETPLTGCPSTCDVHYKTYDLLKNHRFRSIDMIAAFSDGPKSLGTGENQIDLTASLVSATIFPLLNASPELGRTFSAEEDQLGAAPMMLIGHDVWNNYFGADSAIIGKTFMLSDEPFTVIGVMPPGFAFESRSQIWLAATRYLDPTTGTSRRSTYVMARLAPGATMAQLETELRSLEASANETRGDKIEKRFEVEPLRTRYVNATQSHDLIFAAIVAAIVLIACANVASLVLVRAMRHRRELAVRAALGASGAWIARYVFVQNLVLTLGGLIVGLTIAALSLGLLRSAAELRSLRAPGMEYSLTVPVVGFAVLLSIVAAVVLSIGPSRLALRTQPQQTLREGALTVTTSRRGHRTQRLFVMIQTACAVALLVGTGLMVRTVLRFRDVVLGYDANQVVQVTPIPSHGGRTRDKYLPMADRLLVDFGAIPGVERVAIRTSVPFAVGKPGQPPAFRLAGGQTLAPDQFPTGASAVSPDYFKVMGIDVIGGRPFELSDVAGGPAVAIINQWAARHWWPNENPVGKTFTVDTAPGVPGTMTVVGVVRDNLAGQGSVLMARPRPEVFRPFAQANFWIMTFYARIRGGAGPVTDEMQKAVMRLVPNGRPGGGLLANQVEQQLRSVRTNAMQIAGFAIVGLLLAMTGLYGVLSYLVQQRTQEIGIRGVLGASRERILGMILRQALGLCAVGLVAGLVAAFFGMRLIRGMLFGTPPNDPLVYAVVVLVFVVVALLASYLPALRATRVDPARAIRST